MDFDVMGKVTETLERDRKILRMNLLGGMHEYITAFVNDEDLIDEWLTHGVPDEPSEEDLETIAEDDVQFKECAHLFGKLVFED